MQEALVSVHQHLGQLRDPAAFPGWFKRIVRRQCRRVAQRHRQRSEMPAADLPLTSDRGAAGHGAADHGNPDRARDLARVLDRLPPHERLALRLFYWEGYSYREISGLLGLPLSTVKKRLYSARQRLKTML